MFRARQRRVIEATISEQIEFVPTSRLIAPSILTTLTGNCFKYLRELCPMPKSSMATGNPAS